MGYPIGNAIQDSINIEKLKQSQYQNLGNGRNRSDSFQNHLDKIINVSVEKYLRNTYLLAGNEIQVQNKNGKVVGQGVPIEIVLTNNEYYFTVKDKQDRKKRVRIQFEVDPQKNFLKQSILNPNQIKNRQRLEQIKMETFTNSAIRPLMTDGLINADQVSHSSLQKEIEKMQSQNNMRQQFSEEVLYYDKRMKQYQRGRIAVDDELRLLKDGSLISVEFKEIN